MKVPAFLLALFACTVLFLNGCSASVEPLKLSGQTMGTTWSAVVSRPVGASSEELTRRLQAEVDRINSVMSTYDPSSELSLFNKSTNTSWIDASDELAELIVLAKEISTASDGAFDVTAGPLINLWGFGPAGEPEKIPADYDIEGVLPLVGSKNVLVGEKPVSIKKLASKVYVDLSAIAKGYGVDRMAVLLEKQGISDYLVEIGGELRSKGRNPSGRQWRIGIERPSEGERSVQQAVNISGGALATSGDYRNYFEREGKRYSHMIDARTGYPVEHKLASVSVFHASAALADGWATALMVLGEVDGLKLAEELDLAAYFLYRDGDGFSFKATPKFLPLIEG